MVRDRLVSQIAAVAIASTFEIMVARTISLGSPGYESPGRLLSGQDSNGMLKRMTASKSMIPGLRKLKFVTLLEPMLRLSGRLKAAALERARS